mmetsp:Transcript_11019/g.14093  ORF Transcript_11019/g.14093 Transcript_11019/m.14093 type:complete len:565 (+) Transcript_11019:300-1994(+)
MRVADHSGLGDSGVGHQRAFDFGGAHAVARHVDHIVHTAGDPVVAIRVTLTAVAREVVVFVIAEVGLLKALMVAPDGAHLAGPAFFDRQNPFDIIAGDFFAGLRIEHHRMHPKEGLHRRPWFGGVCARQRGHHMAAGLGLPPGVHDRAAAAADHLVVPGPGFRVDRFPHGAEDAQGAEITFLNIVIALAHQGAQRGWRGVELVHAVLFTDLPEARRVRIGGHALKHQRGGAIGQRAIDDVAVPSDPAHIRGAPEDVAVFIVKGVFVRHRRINQIAAGRMHHAFGLPGGAGGVQNEQRIFGVHLGGLAVVAHLHDHLVVVIITAVNPGGLIAGALDHQTLHGVFGVQQGSVGVGFERGFAAATGGVVGGDHNLGVTAVYTGRKRIRAEAGEDNRVDRADAGAGQHGIGRFRDHRQVDHHAVAFAHAQLFEHVGHAADAAVQVGIGDRLRRLVGIIRFKDDRGLIAAGFQMAVDTVGRHIERAVLKPFDVHSTGRKGGVLHLGEWLDPVHTLPMLPPKPLRIRHRGRVHCFVFGSRDDGVFCQLFGRGECGVRHSGPRIGILWGRG